MGLRSANQIVGRRLFAPSTVPRGVVRCKRTDPLNSTSSSSVQSPSSSVPISSSKLSSTAPIFKPLSVSDPVLEDDICLVSQFELDTALASKFEAESVDDSVASDLCSCHGNPRGACPEYIQFVIKFVEQIFVSGKSNQDWSKLSLPYSKLVHSFWRESLGNYFDGEAVADATEFGWDLGLADEGPDLLWDWPNLAPVNHPSARNHPDQVDKYLLKEQVRGVLLLSSFHSLSTSVLWVLWRSQEAKQSDVLLWTVPSPKVEASTLISQSTSTEAKLSELSCQTLTQSFRWSEMPRKDILTRNSKGLRWIWMLTIVILTLILVNPPYQCIVWRNELYIDISWSFLAQ